MSLAVTKQVLALCVLAVHASPIQESQDKQRGDQTFAASYLSKFGYLSKSGSGQTSSLQSTDNAITKFQAFAGLKQTGELNDETLELMKKKRCGVRDIGDDSDHDGFYNQTGLVIDISTRQKRYALQGSRWKTRTLTYRVTQYPTKRGLSRNDVDQTMKKAFEVWSKATNLEFERKRTGDVHIEIRFEKRSHGDDDPFDGEGGTLAHAFFPVYGGDVHFDDEEDWTVNTFRGTSLLMSTAHELGHSLGLSHSDVKSSLMAPFYRGYEKNVQLDSDDIRGIQELYGDKVTKTNDDRNNARPVRPKIRPVTPFPIPTPSTPSDSSAEGDNRELCRRGKLDTMVTVKNGDTYAFLGNNYWKLTQTSVEPGYPRPIPEGWSGLPRDLDAAFTWTNGKTYFFKGSKYWRFSEVGVMDDGYPKNFNKGFEGAPDNVDAAMVWPANNKIYFFKGTKYWKLDPDKDPSVADSYPRPIKNWEGIPNNVDSALQYSNGKTYFFKNGKYYRFDDRKLTVDDDADPAYPRETGLWWFGCKEDSVRLTKQ
eukprot:GFUD01006125.1.p1 GENE.GFUD01006125.1~~GFUD01006125.1.p1  ORF type:complete len:537 (+),score=132.98 GFUD01006125.1:388-1998(+)